jgi:hypothetical protein
MFLALAPFLPWIVLAHAGHAFMTGRVRTAGGLLLAAAVVGFFF